MSGSSGLSVPAGQESSDNLLGRPLEERAGVLDRLFQSHRPGANREIGVDAVLENRLRSRSD